MAKTNPFNMEILRPSGVHLFGFPYTMSSDAVTDRANALAALKLGLLLLDSNWAAHNGGILESEASGGIASITTGVTTVHGGYTCVTTDILITMVRAWEVSSASRLPVYPIVEYNGAVIPASEYKHLGDGKTSGDLCIVIDNAAGKYDSTIAANWKVTLWGELIGMSEMDLGGQPLPQTTTQSNLLGIEDPCFERTTYDGGPGKGSFTCIENVGALIVASSGAGAVPCVLNFPGEDVEKRIYGSNWTSGASNLLSYQDDSVNIALAQLMLNGSFPQLHTAVAGDQGKHFATLRIMYGCRITEIQNVQNTKGSAGDPIGSQWSVEWREVYKQVIKTGA